MRLALGVLLAGNASAQVVNSGFETAGANAALAADWNVTVAAGGPVYAVRTNSNPRTGAYHFEIHLASIGGGPVVEFGQTGIPVIGGANYTFSFYANRLANSISDNHEYSVKWFNTNSAQVGATGYIGYTPGANVYALISVSNLTAPATAAKADILFHSAGGANSAWSATLDIDDVSLTTTNTVPDPVPFTNTLQIAIARSTGIRWFASNSVNYQVQWATDTNSGWTNLGSPIIGNGTTNTVIDPLWPPHNFYQVLSVH
ncbi:MAG: hypothetical protein ACTHKU_17265 [Verrucomicrobiota bacterium]